MTPNLLLMTDSYKLTHWRQYPPGANYVFSFFESRGGTSPTVTFFGLQAILKKYVVGNPVTAQAIDAAERRVAAHLGSKDFFNRAGWEHILRTYGGRLPLAIRAVPEGMTVPTGNVLMTVQNTDPKVPWLTNYLETLLCQVWYPITVCTRSRASRMVLLDALERTGTPSLVDFKLHDFGFRGSTSVESAGLGGMAHLVNFKGTDTMEALQYATDYYDEPMAGFSIPAAEHSTITSWGRENEALAYENMLNQYPTGLVAVVSDSYDIYTACESLWGDKLKEQVLARDGVLVIRPDSGNPVEVVPKVLSLLADKFGFVTNEKGYMVLNPKVRVIQGDGIDPVMLRLVLDVMTKDRWSADNIAFGSGGGLLQKMDRDTHKFAFKCSAIEVSGVWRDVMKDPATDPGKRSKAGRLALVRDGDQVKTVTVGHHPGPPDLLNTVFLNGTMTRTYTLAEVRKQAEVK